MIQMWRIQNALSRETSGYVVAMVTRKTSSKRMSHDVRSSRKCMNWSASKGNRRWKAFGMGISSRVGVGSRGVAIEPVLSASEIGR